MNAVTHFDENWNWEKRPKRFNLYDNVEFYGQFVYLNFYIILVFGNYWYILEKVDVVSIAYVNIYLKIRKILSFALLLHGLMIIR